MCRLNEVAKGMIGIESQQEYVQYLREQIAENPGIDILHDNTYRLNSDATLLSEVLLLQYNVEVKK